MALRLLEMYQHKSRFQGIAGANRSFYKGDLIMGFQLGQNEVKPTLCLQ